MPVKRVLHWQPYVGADVNTQLMNEISQCIESLNAVNEGSWESVLYFYKPVIREVSMAAEFPHDLLGLSISEQQNKYYLIIRSKQIVLEADSSIETIMKKLKSYNSRVSLTFEGTRYRVGDFQLRVGKVIPRGRLPNYSEITREIVMEVEYLPISSIETSRRILEDFVYIWKDFLSKRTLGGQFVDIKPNFGDYVLSDYYTSKHTALQYACFMSQLKVKNSRV